MAVTFGGSASLALGGSNVLSGEEAGNPTFGKSKGASFQVGAVAPQIEGGGGYSGTFTCPTTGGTLNLADSTNICKTGAVGTIRPNQGYVITAVKKLRALYLENLDTRRPCSSRAWAGSLPRWSSPSSLSARRSTCSRPVPRC
jgi:hypothetical protein